MNKQEREEFAVLSKAVFGTRRAWKNILEKGLLDFQTRTVIESIPGEEDEPAETRQVQVAVTSPNGKPIKISRYFTESQLKEYMTDRKEQFDRMLAEFQVEQEARKAQAEVDKAALARNALESQVHNYASGSGN